MRHPTILLVSLALASVARAEETASPPPLEVILVAGQSNAVGFDADPKLLPASLHDAEVRFWYRLGDPPVDDHDVSSDGKWITLLPQPKGNPKPKAKGSADRQYGNFSGVDGGFGPEFGVARTLRERQPQRGLAVVKVAFSGTAIGSDWNPDAEAGDVEGDCYRSLVAQTIAALGAVRETGEVARLRALVWVQGESDANPKDAPLYAQRLEHLITSLREDLQASELIALVAVNTQFGLGKRKHLPDIVAAQQAVAEKDARTVYVDTSEATIANSAHYDTQGTLDVGKWFAEALLKLEADGEE